MKKRAALVIIVSLVLVVSVGVNSYLVDQNLALTKESDRQASQLEMVSILSQAQVRVDDELQRLGGSLTYASEQLSAIGLEGDQVRVVLSVLAANSSFTIEAATQNLNRTMITVEPEAYRSSEGKTIGIQKWLNINPDGPILPSMTLVIPLIVGFDGVSIAVPVFNVNKTLIGTASIAFDHVALLNATITPLIKDTTYAVTVTQTDSSIIYDTDPSQIGKDLTDPIYSSYPELLAFAHRVAEESSGYGTYSYSLNVGSNQVVQKECYWTTISAYGQEWRLALIHALDA